MKKYRVQINFEGQQTLFYDVAKEKDVDNLVAAFQEHKSAEECIIYHSAGLGYETIEKFHKRRIGF